MGDTVRIAMSAKPWLLNFRELPQEILVGACCLDDLIGGGWICCGESGWNRVNHSVIHETEDPFAFEVDAQAVGVEKIGAEKSHRPKQTCA